MESFISDSIFYYAMKKIDIIHQVTCNEGKDTYIDPSTGYQVFTSEALLKQGRCCGNSCRHCPYGHINVPKQASKVDNS
jgi:hypothetical protein